MVCPEELVWRKMRMKHDPEQIRTLIEEFPTDNSGRESIPATASRFSPPLFIATHCPAIGTFMWFAKALRWCTGSVP